MNGVKAVIFDISGTLLDDIHVVWKANCDAYHTIGLDGFDTLEEFREKFKLPVPQFHRDNGVPAHLVSEIDLKFREFYPRYAPLVSIFPEVIGVLEELQSRRMALGVASNIPSVFLREHLRKFDLERYFTAIVGQEDCDEQKPSPKPILAALGKLGVRPQEAMYVGDMEEDLVAAKAAHTLATAIVRDRSYHPRWRLQRQNPHYLISDLTQLPLD
ncbi:MAG: HAD family hydrolase [Dehalococcoidia bacterium]|nr:HAD family hydrolase [Dehalococcoidia bacterium]